MRRGHRRLGLPGHGLVVDVSGLGVLQNGREARALIDGALRVELGGWIEPPIGLDWIGLDSIDLICSQEPIRFICKTASFIPVIHSFIHSVIHSFVSLIHHITALH